MNPRDEALVRIVRDEGRRVLATLIRLTGDVQRAEDALQDAVVRALETWPRDGVPRNPGAWLTVAARRCAIDQARREAGRSQRETEATAMLEASAHDECPRRPYATISCDWCSPVAIRASRSKRRSL